MKNTTWTGVVAACTTAALAWGSWAAAVPNCTTGKLCGNSCISRDKECHVDDGGGDVDGTVVAGVLLGTVAVGGLIWLAVVLSRPSGASSSRAATQPSRPVEYAPRPVTAASPSSPWPSSWPDYPASCDRALPADQITPDWVVGRALERGWKIEEAPREEAPGIITAAWEITTPDGSSGQLLIVRSTVPIDGNNAIYALSKKMSLDSLWVSQIYTNSLDEPAVMIAAFSRAAPLRWEMVRTALSCPAPIMGDPRSEWVPRIDGTVWEDGGAMTLEWGW